MVMRLVCFALSWAMRICTAQEELMTKPRSSHGSMQNYAARAYHLEFQASERKFCGVEPRWEKIGPHAICTSSAGVRHLCMKVASC